MNELRMYCVRCCRVVSHGEGGSLFRTGFFKNDIPMGICQDCSKIPPLQSTLMETLRKESVLL